MSMGVFRVVGIDVGVEVPGNIDSLVKVSVI